MNYLTLGLLIAAGAALVVQNLLMVQITGGASTALVALLTNSAVGFLLLLALLVGKSGLEPLRLRLPLLASLCATRRRRWCIDFVWHRANHDVRPGHKGWRETSNMDSAGNARSILWTDCPAGSSWKCTAPHQRAIHGSRRNSLGMLLHAGKALRKPDSRLSRELLAKPAIGCGRHSNWAFPGKSTHHSDRGTLCCCFRSACVRGRLRRVVRGRETTSCSDSRNPSAKRSGACICRGSDIAQRAAIGTHGDRIPDSAGRNCIGFGWCETMS